MSNLNNEITLAIVANVSSKNQKEVQNKLFTIVQNLQAGDRVYVYHPERTDVFRHPGEAIAAIVNSKTLVCNHVADALKQTIYLMTIEDRDIDKYIIFITDTYPKSTERHLRKGFGLNEKEDAECKFLLVGLDDVQNLLNGIAEDYEDCMVINDFPQEIIEICFKD